MTNDRRTALAALTAAGVIWGLTVPLSKLALGWLDATWLTLVRFAVAAPVLALIGRAGLRAAATPRIAAWGAAGFGGGVLLQNLGIERTGVGHAALIVGAVPALVALTAAAGGRATAGPLAWGGFAVALGGVAAVAGAGGDASLLGDGLVLASAAIAALYIVAQTELLPGRDPGAVTAVQMTAAAAFPLPPGPPGGELPAAPPNAHAVIAAVLLATAGSLLPFTLYAYGQTRVTAEVAGAFVNLEPLVGAAMGALAFQDPFGPSQLAGAAAILGGILLSAVSTRAPITATSSP